MRKQRTNSVSWRQTHSDPFTVSFREVHLKLRTVFEATILWYPMEDRKPGKAKRSMDNWQLTPTYIGCPASGGCNYPRASFSNMKGITFSTRSCLLLAWNCVAGTQLDPSFSLLTVHGWFGLVFFDTIQNNSFKQHIHYGFLFCVLLKKATAWKGKTDLHVPVLL